METNSQVEEFSCAVCGQGVTAAMSAECNWCDGRYHLNQRNDGEAKDCGRVWIDEQYLALQFACDNCLSGESAQSPAAAPRPARGQSTRPRRYRRRT
jgi:hypothetical protein